MFKSSNHNHNNNPTQPPQLLQRQQKNYSADILVVDDESDTAFTYKSLLLAEGYNVDVLHRSSGSSQTFCPAT